MPVVIQGSTSARGADRPDISTIDLGYTYPDGFNLRPGSDLHNFIKDEVLKRARESAARMNERHDAWEKVERTLQAYVPLDAEEARIKAEDPRKPVSIVIPVTYATLETLLTYLVAAFLGNRPIFRFEPRGPEDTLPTALMEILIDWQCQRKKAEMALHTLWRDAWVYGFGAVTPVWTRDMGYKTDRLPQGFRSFLTGLFQQTGWRKQQREIVLFEGNELRNLDPKLYLPDPNTPVHDVEHAEFVSWVVRDNLMTLLEREQYADSGLFNVGYLKHVDGRSSLFDSVDAVRSAGQGANSANPVDVVWQYIRLIPREWRLGDRDRPEKWLFGIGGDEVVIHAKKLNLDHNRFPSVVCAPDTDGRSVTPISKLEVSYGLQETIDWLFASHIANTRKAINDMIVYDPWMINGYDLANPKPGKLIRSRRAAWGRDIRGSIMQLGVTDVTRGHIADSQYAMNILQRVTGATDVVQGMMREGGERRSATEARGARVSALSRLEKAARMISVQCMGDIGYLMASQTQQLMSEETYLRVVGRWGEKLRADFGYLDYARVTPFDILCEFDVIPQDGTVPNADHADIWVSIFQSIASSEVLSQRYDLDRLFRHIARMTGAKNIDDFALMNVVPQVMPDETVMNQVQAGNMVPVDQAGAA